MANVLERKLYHSGIVGPDSARVERISIIDYISAEWAGKLFGRFGNLKDVILVIQEHEVWEKDDLTLVEPVNITAAKNHLANIY